VSFTDAAEPLRDVWLRGARFARALVLFARALVLVDRLERPLLFGLAVPDRFELDFELDALEPLAFRVVAWAMLTTPPCRRLSFPRSITRSPCPQSHTSVAWWLRFARSAGRQRLAGLLHHVPLDVVPVLGQTRRELGLADAVEVANAPVELLQCILRSLPEPLGLSIFSHDISFVSSCPEYPIPLRCIAVRRVAAAPWG
jgi:hypothetical protein